METFKSKTEAGSGGSSSPITQSWEKHLAPLVTLENVGSTLALNQRLRKDNQTIIFFTLTTLTSHWSIPAPIPFLAKMKMDGF